QSRSAWSGSAGVSPRSGRRHAGRESQARRHAMRSLICKVRIRCVIAARRLPGPRSFPQPTPSKQPSRALLRQATASGSRSGFLAALLVPLPILALLSNTEFAAHFSDGIALAAQPIGLQEFPDDLLRGVAYSLLAHLVIHSPHERGDLYLHNEWT